MKNKPVLLAMIAVGLAGIAVGALAVLVFSPTLLNGQIAEATVRETLRANPEIVLEALQTLQTRRADANLAQQRAAIATNRTALLDDPNSFVAGNPQGDVTVVEFFDYRCPYCRKSLATVRDLLKSDPNVRLVYKEFPILGPQSMIAAQVAVAARKDSRYEALHDALMTAPSPLDKEASLRIAANLGFDRNALAAAMNTPEIDAILKANHALATSLGIAGTPAFVVGDTLVPGAVPLADLKSLVAKVRARGGDRAFARSDG